RTPRDLIPAGLPVARPPPATGPASSPSGQDPGPAGRRRAGARRPPAVPRPSVVRPACAEPAAGLSGPGPACPVPGRYRREQRGGCRGRPAARPPLRDRWVYGWTLRAADRRPPRAPRSRGGGGGARPRRSPTPVDLGVIDRSRPRTRTGERCRTGRYINGLVAPPQR